MDMKIRRACSLLIVEPPKDTLRSVPRAGFFSPFGFAWDQLYYEVWISRRVHLSTEQPPRGTLKVGFPSNDLRSRSHPDHVSLGTSFKGI